MYIWWWIFTWDFVDISLCFSFLWMHLFFTCFPLPAPPDPAWSGRSRVSHQSLSPPGNPSHVWKFFFFVKVKSEKARLDTSNLPDLHFPLWRFQIAWIVFPWEEDWHLVKFNPGRRGAGFCTWNTSGPTQCTQQCSIQSNERKVKVKREINLLRPQSCQQIFCNDLKCFRQPSMILRHGS